MFRPLVSFLNCLIILFAMSAFGLAQTNEQITLTTYYPSPQGSYLELRAKRLALGDSYVSPTAYCWAPAVCANVINANTDLVVEGNVGIGLSDPMARLEVSDGTTVNTYQRMFTVHGNSGGTLHTAAFYNNLNYGVVLGAEDTDQFGSIDAGQFVNGMVTTSKTLILNRNGGNVGIGSIVVNPSSRLQVSSPGWAEARIQSTTNGGGADIHFETPDYNSWSLGMDDTGDYFRIEDRDVNERFVILPSGNIGIGTNTPGYILDVQDAASKVNSFNGYLTNGADYAEYFVNEEQILQGSLVGLDLATGKVRKYRSGDEFIGIVSAGKGFVGNGNKTVEIDPQYTLVGLLGQLDVNQDEIVLKERLVYTKDNKRVGFLLGNGKVLVGR